MKIRLIADRSNGTGDYTEGKIYKIFDESEVNYFLYDDDDDLRYINKTLKGNLYDWEIVEE